MSGLASVVPAHVSHRLDEVASNSLRAVRQHAFSMMPCEGAITLRVAEM